MAYANNVLVGTRAYDVTLRFSYEIPGFVENEQPVSQVTGIISMSPQLAKTLVKILKAHLDQLEEQLGPIPVPALPGLEEVEQGEGEEGDEEAP